MNRWGLFCATALALAACTSSEGDTESTSPETVASTTSVTNTTTTTRPATTTTTTTTATTLAPTTTVDPISELEAAIERDLNLGEQALLTAAADPGDQALRQELERYYSGTSLDLARETLDVLVADGLRGRPSPDVQSVVRVLSITDLAPDIAAQVTVVVLCRVDAGVIVEPLEDGGEIIVNDRVRVVVTNSRVTFVSGIWVLDGGELVEELGADQGCE